MNRAVFVVVAALAAGCASHGPRPAPAPLDLSEQVKDSISASARSDSIAVRRAEIEDSVRAAVLDSVAELRLAADSVADAEILERLAEADPDAEGSGEQPGSLPNEDSGGASSVNGAAVTWDIDVETYNSHARVQYYLDFFQGPARDRMAIWLTRMPRYESMIRTKMQQYGLPGDMVYLALIESGFSNTAVSRSRAVGMWQFMKGTGKLYGLKVDRWVDDRRDPYKATDAAARFLVDLNERFGSLYLAAAAYNAGAGKVGRGLARLPDDEEESGDASFFRLYDTKYLRRETKDYVPKLIAAALIAKEPARYGFQPVPASMPDLPDSILVPDATGLDVIARLADTTLAAIRELNPQYLRLMTPPRKTSVVRLPAGIGLMVAAEYAQLPPNRRVVFVEHFVVKGETLGEIARTYRVSTDALLDANPGLKPKALRVGQRIIIPRSGGTLPPRPSTRNEPDLEPNRTVENGSYHRVRSGESLWSISQDYGVTISQLRAWNGMETAEVLKAGQRIRVAPPSVASATPVEAEAPKAAPPSPAPALATYVVRRGDTLSAVAKRYGVTVAELIEVNGLQSNTVIKTGATLKIPG